MRFLIIAITLLSTVTINAQDILDAVSFSETGITHLEVSGNFAKVEIKGVSGDQLQFDGELKGRDKNDGIKIRHERSGTRLRVWIERPKRFNNWYSNLNGTLQFTVPENIELKVDNSSGAVIVSNINADACHLEASSGRLEVENITAETYLGTSSGRIMASEIAGNLETKSSSGRQVLDQIKGDIESVSTSGKIYLSEVEGRLNLRNSSGGITGEAVTITGNSKFRCTSGSVKIELTKDIESYTYECKASSGSIYIGDRKVGKDAYYKYGDIIIEGETSSGGQKYWSR